jgi:multiple sugar transport system ATP-binding protein
VRETARILDLEPYLERKPKALSGGQRQRVAMGRAIVRQPSVYLMDEPLSNLDAKLRVQTRTELVELQHRLGVTTVYVTHDQVEAMTMGHRVAVLKDGVLQQADAPATLYHEPANLFVAGFIGSPAMNLVPLGSARPLRIGGSELAFDGSARTAVGKANGDITVGFRPEAVRVGDGPLRGRIRNVEDLGSEVFVHVAVENNGDSLSVVSKMTPPFAGQLDENVGLEIRGTAHFFAGDGSRIASTDASLR